MSAADELVQLSDRVRSSAVVLDNGEVVWPFDVAVEAITELAGLQRVVLGVDAREQNDTGSVTEVPVWVYEPSGSRADVDRARNQAIEAVRRAEAITGWARPLILVRWRGSH